MYIFYICLEDVNSLKKLQYLPKAHMICVYNFFVKSHIITFVRYDGAQFFRKEMFFMFFKKTIFGFCSFLFIVALSLPVVNAESVYKGKINGCDVWHVTGNYHISHEMEWIKFENRNVIGGRGTAANAIIHALDFWNRRVGYLRVVKTPDGKFIYMAMLGNP